MVPSRVKPRSMAGGGCRAALGGVRATGVDGMGRRGGGAACLGGAPVRFGGAAVHGCVGEGVGGFVLVAERVGDLEGIELGDAVAGQLPERFEVRRVDFVAALDLADHEF